MVVLLIAIGVCVLGAAALTALMFRRDDAFLGLVGLFVITVGGFVAVVYGGLDS